MLEILFCSALGCVGVTVLVCCPFFRFLHPPFSAVGQAHDWGFLLDSCSRLGFLVAAWIVVFLPLSAPWGSFFSSASLGLQTHQQTEITPDGVVTLFRCFAHRTFLPGSGLFFPSWRSETLGVCP